MEDIDINPTQVLTTLEMYEGQADHFTPSEIDYLITLVEEDING